MRLIDADELMKSMGLENAVKYGNKTAEQQDQSYSTYMCYEIADSIESAPTIEAEPIVRCKDCRFFEKKQSILCDMHHRAANENDYCSYGVRKEATGNE